MNTNWTADRRILGELEPLFALGGTGNAGKDRPDVVRERTTLLYSANQQLIEVNELLAMDRQKLQAVQGQLDLAMARPDRYADESEMATQKRTDQDAAVDGLMDVLKLQKVKA
jgi:hypothetical protein